MIKGIHPDGEMANTRDLKSLGFGLASSSLAPGTKQQRSNLESSS